MSSVAHVVALISRLWRFEASYLVGYAVGIERKVDVETYQGRRLHRALLTPWRVQLRHCCHDFQSLLVLFTR
jgi:hypothetical protein